MAGSVISPVSPHQPIRAVLFDVDGTLYRQAPLRALMAIELLTLPLAGPSRAARRFRALSAYRQAQDHLRRGVGHGSIAAAQVAAAAADARLPAAEVERLVDEWMQKRPLKYLRWCRAAGLDGLLDRLAEAHVPAGVLSDYPAVEKLAALGLAGRFSPVLCASDPDISALKPHPRGFLRACEVWQLNPQEVLYIGDRADVDGAGAAAAGMPCVIIGRNNHAGSAASGHLVLPSIERLRRVLDEGR